MIVKTFRDWWEEGTKLFGTDVKKWRFVCVNCGEVQTMNDFIKNKVQEHDNKFYYNCIGRYDSSRGCDWSLGGLLQMHKTEVFDRSGKHTTPVFEFATKTDLEKKP